MGKGGLLVEPSLEEYCLRCPVTFPPDTSHPRHFVPMTFHPRTLHPRHFTPATLHPRDNSHPCDTTLHFGCPDTTPLWHFTPATLNPGTLHPSDTSPPYSLYNLCAGVKCRGWDLSRVWSVLGVKLSGVKCRGGEMSCTPVYTLSVAVLPTAKQWPDLVPSILLDGDVMYCIILGRTCRKFSCFCQV